MESSADIGNDDLLTICRALEGRLDKDAQKMDRLRKQAIAAIGGWLRMQGKEESIARIKEMCIRDRFGIGSLLAGIAWTAAVMIAARFIQGVGSAILAPTSLALIMDYFEGAERVKAVAWYSCLLYTSRCV